MAKYKLSGTGVKDTEKGHCIPNSMGNRHWREYQEWLAEGNTPDPEFTQEDLDNQAAGAVIAADNIKIAKAYRSLGIQKAKDDGDLPGNWIDPEDNDDQGEN